jgi:hypothetical protein
MRKALMGFSALALLGCGSGTQSFVHADTTTLGRVVVYRNGVAYFERYARVADDKLTLSVPADKVDDFLKSLSVVDARTGDPAPVAYPTKPDVTGSGLIDMQVRLQGASPHDLKLSYVTEAPAWKPSYRVVLGAEAGRGQPPPKVVDLVGWAVVDNTSGEDWKGVKLGVGASSALSFRFDLRSVRLVERETLQDSNLFALAPPTGEVAYGGPSLDLTKKIVGDVGDEAIPRDEAEAPAAPSAAASRQGLAGAGVAGAGMQFHGKIGRAASGGAPSAAEPARPSPRASAAIDSLAAQLRSDHGMIVVEGFAAADDADKQAASLERANRVREKLVRDGVAPGRVVAVGRGVQAGHAAGARIVEGPAAPKTAQAAGADPAPSPDITPDPIGTSHFESTTAMSVPRGTSAMVSIFHESAEGEVVYLYDPQGPRGNARFAFKALRLRNPTDSQLESGPVTVFGEGRFIGEGLSEPIPAHQVAFVPFALDRQVVVDRTDGERDEIARIITVQRGVFSTQVQHVKKSTFVLNNRLPSPTVVYIRHALSPGFHLSKGPRDPEHVGNADLYRVEVPGLGKQEVTLEESTPVFRTADIRSSEGMELVRAYVSSAAMTEALKGQLDDVLKTQKEIGDDEQRIATLREQMGEYRIRMDELHAQVVTLRVVRSGGLLMSNLERKLQEVSDRLSKATIDVVSLEEKLMLARIKFEDAVADLSLQPSSDRPATAKL